MGTKEDLLLKPCPFCGWEKCKVQDKRRGKYSQVGTNYQIHCNKCHSRGPISQDSKDEAIKKWNKRRL